MSLILENWQDNPNREAIVDSDISLSFAELFSRALSLARILDRKISTPGARVGIRLKNRIDYAIAYLSGIFGSFTLVPLKLKVTESEFEYIRDLVKLQFIIDELPELPPVAWHDIETQLKECEMSKIWSIFFTSGTTSKPKGVCHRTDTLLRHALAFGAHVNHTKKTRMLHLMPIEYLGGMVNTLICPILNGGTVLMAPDFSPSNAHKILDFGQRKSANAMWISPSMGMFFSKLEYRSEVMKWAQEELKDVFVGTAPLLSFQKETIEKKFKISCFESYGMTEILLASSQSRRDLLKSNCPGKIVEGYDFDFSAAPEANQKNQSGKLRVKTSFKMAGYWDPVLQAPAWPSPDEWFETGDVGYVDKDNQLHITGRTKDIIIKGGINISPRSLEEIILIHPMVLEVAVIGVPHAFWGEEIVACIIAERGFSSEADLKSFARKHLTPDKIPLHFIFLDNLPKTSTGKIQKSVLREKFRSICEDKV